MYKITLMPIPSTFYQINVEFALTFVPFLRKLSNAQMILGKYILMRKEWSYEINYSYVFLYFKQVK